MHGLSVVVWSKMIHMDIIMNYIEYKYVVWSTLCSDQWTRCVCSNVDGCSHFVVVVVGLVVVVVIDASVGITLVGNGFYNHKLNIGYYSHYTVQAKSQSQMYLIVVWGMGVWG